MKKYLSIFIVFLSVSFSGFAFAEATATLNGGPGTTVQAVEGFNKAVAATGGTVDRNAQTDYSSAGDFNLHKATMFAEKNEKGNIVVKITVARKRSNIGAELLTQGSFEKEILQNIINKMTGK